MSIILDWGRCWDHGATAIGTIGESRRPSQHILVEGQYAHMKLGCSKA